MPINSKEKGKRGERKWVQKLKSRGFDAERGQQYCGSPDSPDVKCPDLPFHFEVKWVEKLNIRKAMHQACKDAGEDMVPAVAHYKNNDTWLVTMLADDWLTEMSKRYG